MRTSSWAASLLLSSALLLIVTVGGRALRPDLGVRLLPLSVALAILLAVARCLLACAAAGRRGSALLVVSAVFGLVGAVFLVSWLGPRVLQRSSAAFVEVDLLFGLVALALQSVGMRRAGQVPTWVAAIGLASSSLGLFARMTWTRFGIVPSYSAVALEVVFFAAAAFALLAPHRSVNERDDNLSPVL